MTIYDQLGLRRVINAEARLTRLGGSIMPPEVRAAMEEAAASYVDLPAFQRAAGERLARLTRNEAAYVVTGAAAGLVVSALACMLGDDLRVLARFINGRPPPKDEVIIHLAHRIPYDIVVKLAGATLVPIGNVFHTSPWELEAAITERTAMVLYVAGDHLAPAALSLAETIAIAHRQGVPVVVDAAAQLPPVENLWRFTRDLGADLAVFSGGKDLCGPQASGLVVGRPELIEACRLHGAPNQRLGRPMKVGKEELAGLLAAVERYLTLDHDARLAGFEATVQDWIATFADLPGIHAERSFPNEAGQPTPRLRLTLHDRRAADLHAALWDGDPRIAAYHDAHADALFLTPDTLELGEAEIVTERVRAWVTGSGDALVVGGR